MGSADHWLHDLAILFGLSECFCNSAERRLRSVVFRSADIARFIFAIHWIDRMKELLCLLIFKKAIVLLLLIAMLVQQQSSHAQALPVANYVINKTVGKAIVANLERRGVGYAANDATFARTMNYVGTAANDAMYVHTAVTAVAAVAGAPVWMTVALGVGAVAAVGALAWGTYQLSQKNDPVPLPNGEPMPIALTLQTPGYDPENNPQPQPAPQPGPVAVPAPTPQAGPPSPTRGAPLAYPSLYRTSFGACVPQTDAGCIIWPSIETNKRYISHVTHHTSPGFQAVAGNTLIETLYNAAHAKMAYTSNLSFPYRGWFMTWNTDFVPANGCSGDLGACRWQIGFRIYFEQLLAGDTNPYDNVDDSVWGITYNSDGTRKFIGGEIYVDPNPIWQPPNGQLYEGTLANLQSGITSGMLAEPLPDVLTAQIANRLWQKAAAQPGYDGLPYSVSDPVTPADIAAIRAQNTSPMPTWNDLINKSPNAPGTTTIPISPDLAPVTTDPTPNPNPNPNPPPGSQVDLGPNPNIPSPTLETIPTGLAILGPILSLMPDLKNFTVPVHAGECPKPDISLPLLDRTFTIAAHCDIAEQMRGTIFAMMLAAWSIASLFIVLSA